MADNFIPTREADLVQFSRNFDTLIMASAPSYGLTPAQATAYDALHTAFVSAYDVAIDPPTRTTPAIEAKNTAKEALIDGPDGLRALARLVQATQTVTNQQKADLGLTVRDTEPTPVPVPSVAPGISIEAAVGRTITIRLRDTENPDSRGKPEGVDGATVLTYIGAGPPAPEDTAAWTFQGNVGRTSTSITLPPTVATGATLWITAFWFNTRKQSGPAAQPISTQVPGSLPQAA